MFIQRFNVLALIIAVTLLGLPLGFPHSVAAEDAFVSLPEIALGIPLTAGRDIGPQDVDGSQQVAVINESMARVLFGHENPIGRRFGWVSERLCCYEIIGVVKDAKYINLREESRPMYYVSYAQANFRNQMTLVARTAGNAAPIAAAIQREARTLDPQMPRFEVESLSAQLDASLTQERLIATLSSVFGLLALALVCTGLAFVVFFRLIEEIGAARATVITFVNPVVAVALGAVFLDEPFTMAIVIGFVLVISGCWLATRPAIAPVGELAPEGAAIGS